MKNTGKNNDSGNSGADGLLNPPPTSAAGSKSSPAELFPPPSGVRPVDGEWATAAQIAASLPFATIDETFLRNRAREINPRTSQGWIPAPRARQWPRAATLAGLAEWYYHHSATKSDLPAQYANMQAMENALGTNKRAIKWLLKNGAGTAQDPANRISPLPVIQRAFDIIAQISDGTVTGIDSLQELNKDRELARKLSLESENLEDEKLLRRGEMLISRDGTYAIRELVVEEHLWEKTIQPLRAMLIAAPKAINRQHKSILTGDAPAPEKVRKCADIVQTTIAGILEKLRSKIPKRQEQDAGEKYKNEN